MDLICIELNWTPCICNMIVHQVGFYSAENELTHKMLGSRYVNSRMLSTLIFRSIWQLLILEKQSSCALP